MQHQFFYFVILIIAQLLFIRVFATKIYLTIAITYLLLPMFSLFCFLILHPSLKKNLSAELVFHIPTVFLILKSFCVIFAHHRFDLLSSLLYCFFSLCYDQNKYRVATFLLVFYYIYAHKYYLFRLLILN